MSYQCDFCITADKFFIGIVFRDFQIYILGLLVSSVRLLLLRDLIKFITDNKDQQAYVDGNMENNAFAKFKFFLFSGMAFQVINGSFSALLSGTPFSNRPFQ